MDIFNLSLCTATYNATYTVSARGGQIWLSLCTATYNATANIHKLSYGILYKMYNLMTHYIRLAVTPSFYECYHACSTSLIGASQ